MVAESLQHSFLSPTTILWKKRIFAKKEAEKRNFWKKEEKEEKEAEWVAIFIHANHVSFAKVHTFVPHFLKSQNEKRSE